VAWSECQQPVCAVLHYRNDCCDDLSTINIFWSNIIIIIVIFILSVLIYAVITKGMVKAVQVVKILTALLAALSPTLAWRFLCR